MLCYVKGKTNFKSLNVRELTNGGNKCPDCKTLFTVFRGVSLTESSGSSIHTIKCGNWPHTGQWIFHEKHQTPSHSSKKGINFLQVMNWRSLFKIQLHEPL